MLQLQRATGKTEADLVASPDVLAKADSMPYGELHQEFSELLFYTSLRDMLKAAGYTNFSWRDLHSPTPKRLQCQLSAIVNLFKYLEGQIPFYGELQNQVRSSPTHSMIQICALTLEYSSAKTFSMPMVQLLGNTRSSRSRKSTLSKLRKQTSEQWRRPYANVRNWRWRLPTITRYRPQRERKLPR